MIEWRIGRWVGHVPNLAAFVFGASLANRSKFTRKTTSAFLAALAGGWSITRACRDAGISNRTYYDWRAEHPEFATAADEAIEQGTDKLEDIAWERATRPLDGSDTMLIFLLKARRPAKYRETTRHEITGVAGGEPIAIRSISVPLPVVDELEEKSEDESS